jgi:putative membrane protein
MAMRAIVSEQERARLTALVAEAERNTAGELVVVVARQSAHYGTHRVMWAAVTALVASGVLDLFWPSIPGAWLLTLEGLLGLWLWWLLGRPALLRRIVPAEEQHRAVNNRVKQLFIERGVTETRDRSGVLVFLSELEHRVEILADRGIHEHVGGEAWSEMVRVVVQEIRGGKAAAGLATIIDRIGRELAAKFPPRPDDTNELPNQVTLDEG